MATNLSDEIDEMKLKRLKYNILRLETNNIVKKESSKAMIDKITKLIKDEVEKK